MPTGRLREENRHSTGVVTFAIDLLEWRIIVSRRKDPGDRRHVIVVSALDIEGMVSHRARPRWARPACARPNSEELELILGFAPSVTVLSPSATPTAGP